MNEATPLAKPTMGDRLTRILNPSAETRSLLMILFLALVLRLALANIFVGHPTDVTNFKAWALHLARNPLDAFYGKIWCDYPPAYLYVLWFCGKFYHLFDPNFAYFHSATFTTIIKLPGIICDLISMGLIFVITRRIAPFGIALTAATVFGFLPPVFYESAIWGQMDSVTLMLQLLAILCLFNNANTAAILLTALNILVKPQGLILAPLVLFVIVLRKDWKSLALGTLGSFLMAYLLTQPFYHEWSPIPAFTWLWDHYADQGNLYPYSAIQAFNIWSFTGMWQPDYRMLLGIKHKVWGLLLFSLFYAMVLAWYWLKQRSEERPVREGAMILAATLIMIGFFMLPTRMHERYLFSGVAFMTIAYLINVRWKWPFYILATTLMINLIYELKFPAYAGTLVKSLESGGYMIIAAINVAVMGYLVFLAWTRPVLDVAQEEPAPEKAVAVDDSAAPPRRFAMPMPIGLVKQDWLVIGLVSLFAAVTRFWHLEQPPEQVFDEVYHARTALEYLIGMNPFEWVHPPLAKLLIAIGVLAHGMDSWGWRVVPAIAGIMIIPFFYLMAKNVLRTTTLASLATIILSLDGVYLVQSRMAMTNIFAVLFQIMTLTFFWLYLEKAHSKEDMTDSTDQIVRVPALTWLLLTGLSAGFALSTRWTTIWMLFFVCCVLAAIHLVPRPTSDGSGFMLLGRNVRFPRFQPIFWTAAILFLLVLPVCIYFISYIPYMLQGHSIWDVAKLQPAIYRYHANLRDPHPYYSAWYTWPFLYRPTWYHFHDAKDGTLTGIIALGNPAIWWASLPAVLVAMWMAWKRRLLNIFLGAGLYLAMYLPWAISPRILNYNHYLFEAIPYACLAIAFLCGEFWTGFGKVPVSFKLLKQSKEELVNDSASFLTLIYAFFFGSALTVESGELVTKNVLLLRLLVVLYLLAVAGLFVFFYPLWTAMPITWNYYGYHIWFKKWI